MNEIGDASPGVVQSMVTLAETKSESEGQAKLTLPITIKAPKMSTASIGSDGKVTFEPKGS